ncbi:MAG: hypothetical protein NTY87_07705 [Planctomycetia bacterium]|nr:hypothetical protein [Planctomycetia bacterium]
MESTPLERLTVFLPCHTLDDFPTWLDEAQADDLLAAWTAAWHPSLIANLGCLPAWASVDLPPSDGVAILGIVPATCEDRFASAFDATCQSGSYFVRQFNDRPGIVAAARQLLAQGNASSGDVVATNPSHEIPLTADFHALGLAWLLAELLARRMRSTTRLESTDFAQSVVTAARAAASGEDGVAREHLQEAFGYLAASRSHSYPVDVWLLDLVLLAESTTDLPLASELNSPVPAALVATGHVIDTLAQKYPAMLQQIRNRCAAGTLTPAGGRYDSKPLDSATPEEILVSFARGHRAWREHVGVVPTTYAQCAGGSSAILPQVLKSLGYDGAIWNLFDGTPLPDPGTSRIRWEGSGSASIDCVARPPLDARSAQMVLSLAEKIGDAMDHDHTAVIQFAHYPGTASRWFEDLRRIGAWSTVLGTFVTPDELFRRTAGAGVVAAFEPDTFPVMLPAVVPAGGTAEAAEADPIGEQIEVGTAEAKRLAIAQHSLAIVLPKPSLQATPSGIRTAQRQSPRTGLWQTIRGGFFGTGSSTTSDSLLESDQIRVQVQNETGGVLSVRRPCDRSNQLSQRLALRTTQPAPSPGKPWETAEERAEYSQMVADTVKRIPATVDRGESIESRGRLLDAQGREVGTFAQHIAIAEGLPLVLLGVEVTAQQPMSGPLYEEHLACRFAWNENSDIELCRSLHSQSIVTERTRFTAPHFIELKKNDGGGERPALATNTGRIGIFTYGLPWHLHSAPHMLDSVLLAGGCRRASRRLAIGLGIEQPWTLALALIADTLPTLNVTTAYNVRITVNEPVFASDGSSRMIGANVGLLECAGQSGEVRIEWGVGIESARIQRRLGRPADGDAIAVDGSSTTLRLKRYEWLHLELGFRQ